MSPLKSHGPQNTVLNNLLDCKQVLEKKNVFKNCIGKEEKDSSPVIDSSNYLLYAEKPKSDGKADEVKESLQSMQKDILSVGHWVGKYQQNHEKKREKRRLNTQAQYEQYVASKSHGPQNTVLNDLLDCKQVLGKKNVFKNCIGKEGKDSSPVIDSSNYLLYAEKLKPKSDGKADEVKESLQSMQKDILSVGHWVGKYRQNHEKKREKRRLNTQAQYEQYVASKSHGPQNTVLNDLLDCKQVLGKKNVFKNCIGKEEKDSSPVIDSSNYLLYAEKLKPKSDGKADEVKESLQSMQKDILSVGHWVGKYQQNHEKKREKRRLNTQAQYEQYVASKSHGPQNTVLNDLLDCKQVLGKKNVFKNCIGKEEKDSSPVIDSSNYLLYAEKLKPKSDGKADEVKESLQSMQKDILSVGHWVGKYQQNHEKKREKRRLNTQAQYEQYVASKSHGPQNTVLNDLLDCKQVLGKKNVFKNYIGKEEKESSPVIDSSNYLLYAEKLKPKSDGKADEVKESLQSMQKDILSVGHWVGKYQQNHEKKREKRRLNTQAQYEQYVASKSHGPQNTVLNDLLDWSVC
ncbi:uncharacterized protein LOC117534064 isoform X2 [Gymnodraco acuticeps]|uniref:Uncharacterized protein LOC117534064 isoform X2 n=1 Tax=Gymnodraco acuticeps TaxID=8218 RepID=A0A6P8SUA2_GYMAC|nr:uncharacterized protein LOC117534064 isoform X2 [Gymnodraco acuticeps]